MNAADENAGGASNEPVASDGRLRIDRWLWFARFFKSRSTAADAVAGGRVHLNGERVKAAHTVRAGDRLSVVRGPLEFECLVRSIPKRRGPAPEAARAYSETAESAARCAALAERMRLAPTKLPRPATRPDKHDRRLLRRVRGRE